MARIRPYESQVGSQGSFATQAASPNDAGGAGLTNLGQAVEGAGGNLGTVQRIVQNNATRAAVTDVHTMLAGARAEYTKQALDFETKADPADTDLWDQFYHGGRNPDEPTEGTMKWYLDSYREKITDPTAAQAFDRGAADLTSQFAVHFAQMQSRMAGVNAKNQAVKLLDRAQATVQTDPSTYPQVINDTMAAISDPHTDYGRLTEAERAPIKRQAGEQISKSAMQGLINIAPEQALRQLQNNTHGMTLRGEDVEPLMHSAETAIRAKDVEGRRAEAEALRQKKAMYDSTDQSIGAQYALNMGNPGNSKFPPVTATDVGRLMQADKLDGPTGRAWLNMIDADSKEHTPKTDPGTLSGLLKDIYRPYGDPKKLTTTMPIIDAATARKLSPSDFKFLREEYTKSRDDEGQTLGSTRQHTIESMKTSITKSNPAMGKLDSDGDILYGQFQSFAAKEEARLIKDGKDPHSLYDPESPNYIKKYLPRFQKTMMESIKSIGENLKRQPGMVSPQTGGTPPEKQRLPKETPEQYLERMKKK